MGMNNYEGRCILISVLIWFWRRLRHPGKTAELLPSPTLSVVSSYQFEKQKSNMKESCEVIHKNPLRQSRKGRYQNASLTAEASVAFPVFFFAVVYLIQMFSVLRAELVIAEAGISSARETAAYSYVAERLADGENAVAETLLEIFDQKIVQDVALTTVFYVRCDKEVLEQARVAQGLGGIWVNTSEAGDKTKAEIYYRVKPADVLTKSKGKYYVMRLVYRNWTGEGGTRAADGGGQEGNNIVYMTEHGRVYHLRRDCSYIKIDVEAVLSERVGTKRNSSGAKYYACEFCDPVLYPGKQVYITEYGTRYHAFSTCSAIKRNVKECDLEEAKKTYPACSRCGKSEGGDT